MVWIRAQFQHYIVILSFYLYFNISILCHSDCAYHGDNLREPPELQMANWYESKV